MLLFEDGAFRTVALHNAAPAFADARQRTPVFALRARANHPLGAAIAGRSCNITDATPKVIAVAKVRANIVIHICSSIAWQAGARPVSQPPAPGTEPQPIICAACAYYWRQARHFFRHWQNVPVLSLCWRDSAGASRGWLSFRSNCELPHIGGCEIRRLISDREFAPHRRAAR